MCTLEHIYYKYFEGMFASEKMGLISKAVVKLYIFTYFLANKSGHK